MDNSSTKTSLYSSNTMVEQDDQWYGHLPCVFGNYQRGCHEHNPTQSLIYYNPRLPPNETRLDCLISGLSSFWHSFWGTLRLSEASETSFEPLLTDASSAKDPVPSPLFCMERPFDSLSVDTVAPIHPTMPYHLAFYHLDCVRQKLDRDVQTAFIPELSCGGTSSFYHSGPKYTWSSEIYFQNGTFLQKQEICCIIDEISACGTIKFTECPHITFKVRPLWLTDDDGFFVARAWLSFPPINGRETFGFKWWTSKTGRFARMSMCGVCQSDHEQTLELVGRQLHLRNTCYRDLGPATDRSIPRWISLLTGEGSMNRTRRFDLYARVWKTAQQLGRPNLHVIHHKSRNGEFVVNAT
ncbi:hypothetical protein BKA67DRAFT_541986 [Truncatella angustata]|uniref:Uncharacterized protein n=1 Tax=Truncatella angustata TaxID=152316 RepID=A0A9P8RKT9_9PEZI|nr:uncharacterized protein BKA67DRAFT_541986 [Truncatella angustata]KAH6644996.1 hypothetical protein BKA67DRAFT_541986 [Truncatella angustata]